MIGFDDAPFARTPRRCRGDRGGVFRRARATRAPGGARKWRLIECAGIAAERTVELLQRLAVHSKLPEPLRTAHLIAGGITTGESRHRP